MVDQRGRRPPGTGAAERDPTRRSRRTAAPSRSSARERPRDRSLLAAPAVAESGRRRRAAALHGAPPFDTTTFVDSVMKFSPDGTSFSCGGGAGRTRRQQHPGDPVLADSMAEREAVTGAPLVDRRDAGGRLLRLAPRLAATSSSRCGTRRQPGCTCGRPTPNATRAHRVTATVGSENWPNVTADGRRMAFASESIDFDLVDIPLDGTPPRKLSPPRATNPTRRSIVTAAGTPTSPTRAACCGSGPAAAPIPMSSG